MRARSIGTVVACAVLALPVSAAARPDATSVTVTAGKPSEFRFTLSKRTMPKGVVVFTVINRGALHHDFKIAGKKTPMLMPGKRAMLRVTFKKAGRYTYICAVAGHAAAGMKGALTVR